MARRKIIREKMSDRELVAGIIARDEHACRYLIENYSGRMRAAALRRLPVYLRRNVDDVIQNSIVLILRCAHQFEFRSSFATWIGWIVANQALDAIRKSKCRPVVSECDLIERTFHDDSYDDPERRLTPLSESLSADSNFSAINNRRAVLLALTALPRSDRELIWLYHFEGLKMEQIGERLSIHPGAVRTYVFRARQRMREYLRGLGVNSIEEALAA